MSEERQIDAISIGIGANVAGLKASLEEAQRLVSGFDFRPPGKAEIPFTVVVNTGVAENRLKKLTSEEREIRVRAVLIPTQTSMADFRKLLREKLASGADFRIPFKADLASARTIRNSIQTALSQTPFKIQVAWEWQNGPPPAGFGPATGGGGGPAPQAPPPSTGSGGGAARPPATPSNVITRPSRPVTGRTGGPATVAPVRPTTSGPLPPRYTGAPSRSNTEFQPGVGAARPQGIPPGLDQRLKTAIARLMRTGDPTDIYSILGPFQAMTGGLGRYEGYNVQGLEGQQVNLKQLIDQAMGFAQSRRGRGPAGALREFEEFVPREARFKPETMDRAGIASLAMNRFVQSARGRAAGNQGVYSEQDIGIAGKLRTYLNSIQTQMHAEDPKAFKMAFDTRRGSVDRLKDMGLGALANLGGARAGLRGIGPPTPDFLETLAASERHNKQLLTNENRIANARKRALAKDREARTVINETTGRKRTIPARGLPYVQSTGTNTVQAFIDMLDEAEQDKDFFATKRKGFALGGNIGSFFRQAFKQRPMTDEEAWGGDKSTGYYGSDWENEYTRAQSKSHGGSSAGTRTGAADTRSKVDKLRAMADQTASPNEAAVAKRMLHERHIPGYAMGGFIGNVGYAAGGHMNAWMSLPKAGQIMEPLGPHRADILKQARSIHRHSPRDLASLFETVPGQYSELLGLEPEEAAFKLQKMMKWVPTWKDNPEQAASLDKAMATLLGHNFPVSQLRGRALGGAVEHLQKFFPNAKIDLPGISHDVLHDMSNVSLDLAEKYPEAAKWLYGLHYIDQTDPETVRNAGGFTDLRPSEGVDKEGYHLIRPTISLAHEVLDPAFRQEMSKNIAAGYSPAVTKPEYMSGAGVFSHEFGHLLDWIGGWEVLQRPMSLSQLNPLASILGEGATDYGKTSPQEAFADAFWGQMGGAPTNPKLQQLFASVSMLEQGKLDMSIPKRAGGGRTGWGKTGAYVVGEQGDEVFVPESAGWIIPHHLKDKLPKRAGGGEVGDQPIEGETPAQWKARRAAERKEMRAARKEMNADFLADEKAEKERLRQEYQAPAPTPVASKSGRARDFQGGFLPGDPAQAKARLAASAAIKMGKAKAGGPVSAKDLINSADTPEEMRRALSDMLAASGGSGKAGGGGGGGGGGGSPFDQMGDDARPSYKQTARQRAEARISAIQDTLDEAQKDALTRAGLAEKIATLPQRAPGPAGGQIVANLLGGRGQVLELQRLSQFSLGIAGQYRSLERGARATQMNAENQLDFYKALGLTNEELKPYQQELKEATDITGMYHEQAKAASEIAGEFSNRVGTTRQKLSIFSTNISGVIGATLLYGAAFKGVQTVLDAVVPTVAAFIDEQTGLHATSTRVTSALGAQTKAQHGNVDAVLAMSAAEAGLNEVALSHISNQLRLTAQVKAGAEAQQGASDLFRGAAGAGQGAPQGLFGGYGGLFGTGLLAQQFGGGKGFSEIVQGDLSNLSRPNGGEGIVESINKGLAYVANPDFANLINKTAEQTGQERPTQTLANATSFLPFINTATSMFDSSSKVLSEAAKSQEAARGASARDPNGLVKTYLDNLTTNIARVGGSARYEYTDDPVRRQQAMQAAQQAGDINGMTSASQGFIVTLNGAVATTKDYTTAVEQAARGASLPSEAVVRAALTVQRRITQGTIEAQTAFQTGQLPKQAALQYFGAPPLEPGVGVAPPAGAQGYGGFSATASFAGTNFGKYKAQARAAFDSVTAYAQQGFQSLLDSGIPPGLLNDYKSVGAQIHNIQTDLANQRAVQTAVQYNHQLFITNRALQDARGLTGQRVKNEQSNLGALERQQFLLERQSTALSLALSQRQINFQRAIAGFQAPGLTSEEREARMQQAKIEADYAQKQLNINKQQFSLGGKIFTTTAVRQLQDVSFALADIRASRGIQINTEAAQQTIGLLEERLGIAGSKIGVMLSEQEAVFSAKVSEAATIAATATGTAFAVILKGVNDAWATFGIGAANAYNSLTHAMAGGGGGTGGGGDSGGRGPTPPTHATTKFVDPGHGYATGFLGTVSGASHMLVGEAGAETVAILRNPRNTGYSSGGGGVNITIMVTGNTVRKDADLDELARKLEHVMQRRGALLGLRPQAG